MSNKNSFSEASAKSYSQALYELGYEDKNLEKYWFTKDKVDKIRKIHNYLDSLPAVGKVLSFSSILEVAKKLNNNKELGTLEMGVLYSKLPETIKNEKHK